GSCGNGTRRRGSRRISPCRAPTGRFVTVRSGNTRVARQSNRLAPPGRHLHPGDANRPPAPCPQPLVTIGGRAGGGPLPLPIGNGSLPAHPARLSAATAAKAAIRNDFITPPVSG